MTKVLLTNTNSVWGVIVNPQSSNTYRHAISFENEQMKRDYVSQELFKGTDFTTLYGDKPEIDFTVITGSKAEFVITPTTYPNETMFTLLNKDFCILQVGKQGEEKYLYYTLSGERSGSTIKYTAELDIFFTYNIKDMFNEKDVEIKRGMYDRFIKDDNNEIIYRNSYVNTPILNSENFEDNIENKRFPVDNPIKLLGSPEINLRVKPGSQETPTQEELDLIKDAMIRTKWQIVSMTTKYDVDIPGAIQPKRLFTNPDTSTVISSPTLERLELPYVNFITPTSSTIDTEKIDENSDIADGNVNLICKLNGDVSKKFEPFKRKFLENPSLLKNSLQIIPFSPFIQHPQGFHFEIDFFRVETGDGKKIFTANVEMEIIDRGWGTSFVIDGDTGAIGINLIRKNNNEIKAIEEILNSKNILLDIKNKRNIEYEPKLNFSPYTIYKIGSTTKNKGTLNPEFFTKNEIILKPNNAMLPSNWGYLIEIKNYSNILNNSQDFQATEIDKIYEDFANYSIVTDKDSWQEFMTRNKSQQNANFLSKAVGFGVGALGVAAAPFTAGASLGVTALAGVSIAAKSATDINSQLAQRKDIKNSPNEIINNGSTFDYEFVNKDITPFIQKETIPDLLKHTLYDHIYKHGYILNGQLLKISDLLDNRYYFNYIEISETFENIKLQASAEIKQIINDTLANGLTIWHCRDLATFKGIKNYEYENVEMSLLTVVKGVNDVDKK